MEKQKKKQKGITLIALVISIIVMLILAGVSLNMTIGENGIITKAQEAKMALEDAELWEEIQMILVDAAGRNLEGENFCDFCNNEFNNKNLQAVIKTSGDEYVLTYGKYNRQSKITDDYLRVQKNIASVEGNAEDWNYEILSDGTLKLIEYKKDKTGKMAIPNIIEGYLVTELGNNLFRGATEITELTFSDGLRKIGDYAFANCSAVTNEVIFPSTLREVGTYAFYNCTEMNGSLDNILSHKAKLGKNAFKNCKNLSGNINALLATIIDADTTKIEEGAFSGFTGVTGTLTIPAQIEEIEANAFYGCSSISGIEFETGSKLTKIGDDAFYDCTGMAGALVLPNTLTTIGARAFYNCNKLNSLTLSTSLTVIGSYGFKDCTSIAGELVIPATMANTGKQSFSNCDSITTLSFAPRTTAVTVYEYSFWDCDSLTTVNFPNNVASYIDGFSFYSCNALTTLNNFFKVKGNIGDRAFWQCTKLNIPTWSSEITTIGDNSFRECRSLTTLPDRTSLTIIYSEAFFGCIEIEENIIAYLQDSKIEAIGSSCFYSCSKLTGNYTGTITANQSTKVDKTISVGGNAFGGTNVRLAKLLDLTGKTSIAADEYKNVTVLVDSNNNEITEVTIPSTVTSIGARAFTGTNITKIIIPDSVTTIESDCFYQCKKLTTVELSKNVKTIPTNCFRGCSALTYINKSETSNINLSNVTQIEGWSFAYSGIGGFLDLSSVKGELGGAAFYTCNNLTGVKFGNELTSLGSMTFAENYNMTGSLIIPDSVMGRVPSDATFYKCNFTSVTIGSGITELCSRMFLNNYNLKNVVVKGHLTAIGYNCFINCNSLESITMDWSSLKTIGYSAFENTSKLTGTVNLPHDCIYDIENTFQNCGLVIKQNYVEGDA